ncbi:bacillithiol biosynthesis deacetylase BshB1 [Runella sp. MFBS21]|uniref:bacillithiol biosynthesis deacetylase BshB1 n=1 Tax=Runella sp. MFBS21 TaxID=3034018 RepID=UPI0023F6502B|nr:bacillithiol biosynthesis deacetylase BshB1 [Runella sp. MFBS21]MDF7819678.1 bacillithiol biosynthesis deacetylase BshB1 [Runella sp. MFBS21]
MKLDILAIAAHPDDVELGCAGTLLSAIAQGRKVGILDLTKGELGTRGTADLRLQEAAAAAEVLGVSSRENAGLADGFFRNDTENQLAIVPYIRKYQPDIVLANAIDDRHPDHGKGAALIYDACFMSGLRRVETKNEEGLLQAPWRPKYIYHFVQDRYIKPDFVVDITPYWDKKEAAIRAFKSQFYDPNSTEPNSYISSPDFLNFIKARAEEYGHAAGFKYGEGFTVRKIIGIKDLWALE